ncbi:MAG: hypothetical protein ABSH11_10820 [Verrucomicrobiota bacterium]|jgi:hypothetical protein
MKKNLTPAQEAFLRKVFSSDQDEREQVITLLDPKIQQDARNLIKVRRDFQLLIPVLMSDLGHASCEMNENPGDQFWRRMAIRALAATLDGMMFSLKQLTLGAGKMTGFTFSDEELFLLNEGKTESKGTKKGRLPGFRDNIKQTFKLFARVNRVPCPTDFGQSGFEALCETYELRHRLMHPKSFMNFCVNDEEKKKAGDAIRWLAEEGQKLLAASSQSLDNFDTWSK